MAIITRRSWPQILSETIVYVGGHDYTGFSDRARHAVWTAYQELCLSYHHYELESTYAFSLTSTKQQDLPLDCYVPIAVTALVSGSIPYLINPRRLHFALSDRWATTGEDTLPTEWARYNRTLLFNGPTTGTVTCSLYYYKSPLAPDFDNSGSYPETHTLWDEHIIELAVAKLQRKTWRPDLSQMNAQALGEWLTQQIQPSLKEEPLPTLPDSVTASRPHGGLQG